jgi:predicted heme/steroid binding protein
VNYQGGGQLTDVGKGFQLSNSLKNKKERFADKSIFDILEKILRLIHILTAFLWFGTILYVHLILKPTYASQGLPRGEVKVGLISLLIMPATGFALFYLKGFSFPLLLSSRFGVLLLIKITIFFIMAWSALVVVFLIGPRLKKIKKDAISAQTNLTMDELSIFNGKDEKSAYVGFKGKIYDVTNSSLWDHGIHMQRHQAGQDLTEIISQAPHEEDKILSRPQVGEMKEGGGPSLNKSYKKIFYIMAYVNLSFVFVISLILALWR